MRATSSLSRSLPRTFSPMVPGVPSPGASHVVVGRADQVAGVALLDQLGDRPAAKRNIIRMRLDGQ